MGRGPSVQNNHAVASLTISMIAIGRRILLLSMLAAASCAAQPMGRIAAYDPHNLPSVRDAPTSAAKWPHWRRSLHRWEWSRIPGTDLSAIVPSPPVPGSPRARIDAWNGLAADVRTSRLFSADNGGHADYAGNEVYAIDLALDAPRWKMLRAPTPADEILKSDYTKKTYNDYYRDGRPSSTHTYYALQFIGSRNAIFKFGAGALWGTGNEANWKTDAFSLGEMDWQPAGSWPDVEADSRKDVIAASICKNPLTDEVYVAAPEGLLRFDPVAGKYEFLSRWPDNASAVAARACAVDTRRKQVVYFGDAYRPPDGGLLYEEKSRFLQRIKFGGPAAPEIMAGKYHFAWYDPEADRFVLKTGIAGRVYAIDPDTRAVTGIPTSGGDNVPDAVNGVQTRWQRLPELGGYAYYPRAGSGIWFLATQ